jgi:DNA-binding transcriptional regulator YhcF (GntR family)
MFDPGRPLFLQIAESIADSIVDGSLAEEEKAPSTNELAAFHRINPATAAKGVASLTDEGILYKKRGIGMFVATGARERLLAQRRETFARTYVAPLLAEANRLGLTRDDVRHLIEHSSPEPHTAPGAHSTALHSPDHSTDAASTVGASLRQETS